VTIQTVAILGAGLMGRGIAYASALGAYRTILQDTDAPALDKGAAEISALLEKGVATGKVAGEDAVAARKRLATTRALEEAVRDADLVIEAVPERIELKVERIEHWLKIGAKPSPTVAKIIKRAAKSAPKPAAEKKA